MMWADLALLFVAKIGINGVNSNLAVTLRIVVMLIIAWVMSFINTQYEIVDISKKARYF